MRRISTNKGFSLIELLTVIAIIAILAGIIFPVMGIVKARAKTVQCMTNLHDLAMGLKMFKEDNRQYPDSLGGNVDFDASMQVVPFERLRGKGLYPEYTKKINTFHCPLSLQTATDAVVKIGDYQYYAYDSYDVFYETPVPSGQAAFVEADALRYVTNWAPELEAVDLLPPYPPGTPVSADLSTYDYKRQLRFRSPSDDTVVTWCSYHARGSSKGTLPVLFLDGHADMMPAEDIQGPAGDTGCRWRAQPKR